jgi:EAL and modified HD-GYP domain-containing signal transduction protein
MAEILVARQPVYTRDLDVYAYELSPQTEQSNSQSPSDQATSQLIINAFMDIGVERLTRNSLALISLSEHFLKSDYELPLPVSQVILKIPAQLQINDEILAGILRLNKQGYKLALDNYLQHPILQPLAKLADIIVININELQPAQLEQQLGTLKKQHPLLLADHVNSHEQYENCLRLGADYIQGYFLNRPRIVRGESLSASQMNVINLLSTLHNPDTDTATVVDIISKDVALSYKLLQLMNTPLFRRSSKIESIQHATVMLGRKQLSSWASMLALSNMDNKPREQLRISMIRARSCELLAERAGLSSPDVFFTVGMLSSLDLLMDKNLSELIKPLPLADTVSHALLRRQGEAGAALDCVLAQEEGDWKNIHFARLPAGTLSDINIEAINWAEDVLNSM